MTRDARLRASLVAVAWVVLGLRLWCVPVPDPEADGTLIPEIQSCLSMANRGLFFQSAPGVSLIKPAYDLGMFAFPSLVVMVVKALGISGWHADLSLWIDLQFGLFAIAVAVCALPAVPHRLAAGAVAFLIGHVVFAGDDPLGGLFAPHYYGYWAPPLAAVVTLVWLLTLTLPCGSGTGMLTACAGLLVGILGSWRVDARGIPCVAALGFAGVLAARWLAARLKVSVGHRERVAVRAGLPVALACLAFVALTYVPDAAVRAGLALHQAATGIEHFDAGSTRGHMVWHNLYLSYATVSLSGPRAEWDDTVGWNHASEYDPKLTTAQSRGRLSSDQDRALCGLYLTTAFEDPVLWVRAFVTRACEIADLCWPSLVISLATLALALLMTRAADHSDESVELALPRGRFRFAYQATAPHAAWRLGPWAAGLALAAAALPPLLYSTLPWYARAVQMVARALPWLLALSMIEHQRRAGGALLDGAAPLVDRALSRVARRCALLGLAALTLVGTAGLIRTWIYASGLAGLDANGWALLWQEDPRRLRVHLPAASRATLEALAVAMSARHGPVKGGGVIDTRAAVAAPAQLSSVAWVGGHVVLWMRGSSPWPGKGAMRHEGGWVDVSIGGKRADTYRMRIGPFERGQILPVLVPVAPSDDTPVDVTIALRAFPAATGGQPVAVVHSLTRTLSW